MFFHFPIFQSSYSRFPVQSQKNNSNNQAGRQEDIDKIKELSDTLHIDTFYSNKPEVI